MCLFRQQLYIPHGFNGHILIISANFTRNGEEADKEPKEKARAGKPIKNLKAPFVQITIRGRKEENMAKISNAH